MTKIDRNSLTGDEVIHNKTFYSIFSTIVSIASLLFLGLIGFMQYNWYSNQSTGIPNGVIVSVLILSIAGRLVRLKKMFLVITLLCDIIVIIYSLEGINFEWLIADKHFFKFAIIALAFMMIALYWSYRLLKIFYGNTRFYIQNKKG